MLAELAREIIPRTNAPLLERALPYLRCAECGASSFTIFCDGSTERNVTTHGVIVCGGCQTCYHYADGILELLREKPSALSLAQRTNFWTPVALGYQEYWRSWCMRLFCGGRFTLENEKHWLTDRVVVSEGRMHVDLGTSHGFYAIAIAEAMKKSSVDGCVIAIDFSKAMLRQAVARAERHDVTDRILFILADVENLPLSGDSANGVTCGGSLNEYAHAETVIAEAHRVLQPNARFVTMHLIDPGGMVGFFARLAGLTGLRFLTPTAWASLFTRSGFRATSSDRRGMAEFTTLEKA